MRKLVLTILLATSLNAMAGTNAGDVNFGLNSSYGNHSIKFALMFSDGFTTNYTNGCVAPATGYTQTLSIKEMQNHTGEARVSAIDCNNPFLYAITTTIIDYQPQNQDPYYIPCYTTLDHGKLSVNCMILR